MKKIIAWMLVTVLALACGAACAEKIELAKDPAVQPIDLSYYEQNSDLFEITAAEDGESAYIRTKQSNSDLAFTTPYDSEQYLNVIFPELRIVNYAKEEDRTPVFRIWIRYRGNRHLNVSAVSFVQKNAAEYRFLDVAAPDWTATKEDGTAAEDMMIAVGTTINQVNAVFFSYLLADAAEYSVARYGNGGNPDAALPEWSVVLHGNEDVEIQIPEAFWTDVVLFMTGLKEEDYRTLMSVEGTPCDLVEIQ